MSNDTVNIQENSEGIFRKLSSQEIAKTIKAFRHLNGSQDWLAAAAGINVKTIQRVESGKGISDESLEKIAEALGFESEAFTKARYIPTAEEAQA